jgi:hypothetical protein
MRAVIAIDPGQSGGIAWRDQEGHVHAENMPATFPEIADRLRELRIDLSNPEPICFIEKTGGYMPGNAGPAAVKFGRHNGHLEMALYCLGISTTQITPQKWMKKLGTFPKDKKARKNAIKTMMATRHPTIKVTLKNADALGLLTSEVENA